MSARPQTAELNQSNQVAVAASAIRTDSSACSVERALEELVLLLCEISALEPRLVAAVTGAR